MRKEVNGPTVFQITRSHLKNEKTGKNSPYTLEEILIFNMLQQKFLPFMPSSWHFLQAHPRKFLLHKY